MQRVLTRVQQRTAEYERAPLLTFLRDPSVSPRRKLAFAPHVAHFVLTFRDLCEHVLPVVPPKDELQALVNQNAQEDVGHWRWFLSDLDALGLDEEVRYSEAIRRLWDASTWRTRRLSYGLTHLAMAADSLGRLVLVETVEAAFKVTIAELNAASRAFTQQTGKPLHYLGDGHADAEAGHAMDEADVQARIASIELSEEQVDRMCRLVDECSAMFVEFAQEMLELSLAHGRGESGASVPPPAA